MAPLTSGRACFANSLCGDITVSPGSRAATNVNFDRLESLPTQVFVAISQVVGSGVQFCEFFLKLQTLIVLTHSASVVPDGISPSAYVMLIVAALPPEV